MEKILHALDVVRRRSLHGLLLFWIRDAKKDLDLQMHVNEQTCVSLRRGHAFRQPLYLHLAS